MFEGAPIQECDIRSIRSVRRNPVIADLFHRMKYMERRGSGLRKIISESEKLPGYSNVYKPEFFSTATDFRVILKNVNYHHDPSIMSQPMMQPMMLLHIRFLHSALNHIQKQKFPSTVDIKIPRILHKGI